MNQVVTYGHFDGQTRSIGAVAVPPEVIDDVKAEHHRRMSAHLAEVFAWRDSRPRRDPATIAAASVRKAKAFAVTSLRGKGMVPLPVAVATFAGGEIIRMTFWQESWRPWDVARARHLVAQVVGNERGTKTPKHAAEIANLQRKIESARALSDRPGEPAETPAAKAAMTRLVNRQRKLQAEIMNATSVLSAVYAPATDFVSFHIEHAGNVIDPATIEAPRPKLISAPRTRKVRSAPQPAAEITPPAPVPLPDGIPAKFLDTVSSIRERYGDEMLEKLSEGLELLANSSGKPGSRIEGWKAGKCQSVRIHLYSRKEA